MFALGVIHLLVVVLGLIRRPCHDGTRAYDFHAGLMGRNLVGGVGVGGWQTFFGLRTSADLALTMDAHAEENEGDYVKDARWCQLQSSIQAWM